MTVLAIDQGTSGTKALVVADDGEVLAEAGRPVQVRYLDGGGVEIDPEQLLASVVDAGRQAVAASRTMPGTVALANQGETVLAWDPATGRALSPAIVWQDRRAAGVCADLEAHAGSLAVATGLRLDPYFSAPKMTWLRHHRTGDGVVTTTDSWLVHHLCGAFVTDISTASRSMLVELGSGDWSGPCLELFGLGGERMPRIVACDAMVGTTRAFGAEMDVGGLIVDQAAALLAHGCTEAGAAKCTFGTGAFLLANCGPRAVASSAGLTTSVAWQIGGDVCHYVDGQVYAAGSALRWLEALGVLSSPAALDTEAADDAGGVMCVPSLAGLAAPWWEPTATAVLQGLTLTTGPGEVVAAVVEGIAAQLAVITEAVDQDLDRPIESLKVDGGLSRSVRLMQAVADVVQRPVDIAGQVESTAIGAAMLGFAASGRPWPGGTPASASTVEPRWSADRAASFRAAWGRLALAQSVRS